MSDRILPPLNALRAFEAAARHLSFSKAAEELHVTPAALSHQIRGLEEFLGQKLFHRMTRQVALTEAGELIRPDIQDGFVSLKRGIGRLDRRRDDNVITVSAGPSFTAKWLAPRLNRFAAAYPDIDLRIAATLTLLDFDKDDLDVSIRFGSGQPPRMHVEHLLDESVTPMCSPSLLEGPNAITRLEDLKNATLIHDESITRMALDAPGWADWLALAGVEGVNADRGVRFNLADHAIDAAIEGSGVVLARRVLAKRDLDLGRLVAPFALDIPIKQSFRAMCPEGHEKRRAIRCFLDWLREEVALG